MPQTSATLAKPVIFGRSSSHFTRVTRLFAAELKVDYTFEIVRNLMSADAHDYGGHPALKVPTLQATQGTWFGALNICRQLSQLSTAKLRILWPETLQDSLAVNGQELVTQAMSTEVNLIMSALSKPAAGDAYELKARKSLENMIAWLETNVSVILNRLPQRDLSYFEATLFCLMTHLEFRQQRPGGEYPKLNEFCRDFGRRVSARETSYRFD